MSDAVRRSTRMLAVAALLLGAPAVAHAGAHIVEGGSIPLPSSTRRIGKVLPRAGECVPAAKSSAKVKPTQRVGRILLRDTEEKSA